MPSFSSSSKGAFASLVSALVILAAPAPARADVVYAELFGKGGLYGVGYERAITPRLALGAAASYVVLRDEQITTLAPYVHGTIACWLYAEVGAILAHSRIPSPVANWSGASDTGGGGFASLGYQHAWTHLTLRTALIAVVGEGGLAPAVGFAIGWQP